MKPEKIKKISLKKGDILTVKFDENMSCKEIINMRGNFRRLHPDNEIMFYCGDSEINVIRKKS